MSQHSDEIIGLISQLAMYNMVMALKALDAIGAKVSACHLDAAIAAFPNDLVECMIETPQMSLRCSGFQELDSFVEDLYSKIN